jgi:phospholipase C
MGELSRRGFLRAGAGLVGGLGAFSVLSPSARKALSSVAPSGSSLKDIEHVVVFCQENRSFDHYFGTLAGVTGFADPAVGPDPVTGRTVFEQLDPDVLDGAGGVLLPWRLDPAHTSAQCLADVDHLWQSQHLSRGGGDNGLFAASHAVFDLVTGKPDPSQGGIRTMSYFTRADLPFHYALADAFTICDRHFCSVLGPTVPNRLYLMSAWLDPDGTHGGPEVNNIKQIAGTTSFSWTTFPEQLQARGIDWKVYRERDDYQDNVLDLFAQYQDPKGELHRRGRGRIADGRLISQLRRDVVNGDLPQVSWIVGPEYTTEHPYHPPADGAYYLQGILEALTADPAVWAKTLLILTYDENGGFFDHVPPPVAPPGTPGEELTLQGLVAAPEAGGVAGPIGLGYRVPTLLISPFTRGGYVCRDTFDHTSVLRLLESRFGAEVANLTAWRRETCGDLAAAIPFGCAADLTMPALPDAAELLAAAQDQCRSQPVPVIPGHQVLPTQERGTRPVVGRDCGAAGPPGRSSLGSTRSTALAGASGSTPSTTRASSPAPAATRPTPDPSRTLPKTGGAEPLLVTAGAAALALALRRLDRAARPPEA